MARIEEKRKKKKGFGIGKFLIIVVVLALVLAGGKVLIEKYGLLGLVGGDIMDDITPIAGGDSDFSREFPDSKRVNILFLGTNSGLSDTMMVFSFDTELKRVDEISVPRDTYYERPNFPGAAYQKINSVYETEGFQGCAQAVSNVLGGVPIHFYAQITDEGVAHVVDAMGGIEMNVPMDMNYEDPAQNLYIHLTAGPQVLDGAHAVQYLRFRSGYPTADLGRVNAQQEFLKEAFKQSVGFGFPKVAAAAAKEVTSDITPRMAVRIGSEAAGMSAESFAAWTIPGVPNMMNGASYYVSDRAATAEMMRQIYSMTAEQDAETGEKDG
ncbi:MAG: LCP family protein [Clostridiales Family XIII bacterium]|jgi:LCP family protein required for cell wall assembly|nr:LCP family protein [Clostridiales Family XIII bacterium]